MENAKKRERASNFSKGEIRLLTELVEKYKNILENKKTDAVTNKDKENAWNRIASTFNATTSEGAVRSSKTLKLKYEGLKKATKKKMTCHRQELYRTGGGPSNAPDIDEVDEKVLAICSNITGLDARNDCDNIADLFKPSENSNVPQDVPELKIIPDKYNDIKKVIEEEISDCDRNQFDGPEENTADTVFILPDENQEGTQETQKEQNDPEENTAISFILPGENQEGTQETQKEQNWSSWKPKALKSKISPCLNLNSKPTKAGVTAKLEQLTKARLELVELQKEIAIKEHEYISEEHKLKMVSLQNDEKRKQEIHEHLKSQLGNRLNFQTNVLDINK